MDLSSISERPRFPAISNAICVAVTLRQPAGVETRPAEMADQRRIGRATTCSLPFLEVTADASAAADLLGSEAASEISTSAES